MASTDVNRKYGSLVVRLKSDIRALHESIEDATALSRPRLEERLKAIAADLDQDDAHAILNFLELKQHLITASLSKILQSSRQIFHSDERYQQILNLN